MTNIKKSWVATFFEKNLLALIFAAVSVIAAYVLVNANVKANTIKIEHIEKAQAQFPTKEWFDLKFKTEREYVDLRFAVLEKKIDECGR